MADADKLARFASRMARMGIPVSDETMKFLSTPKMPIAIRLDTDAKTVIEDAAEDDEEND